MLGSGFAGAAILLLSIIPLTSAQEELPDFEAFRRHYFLEFSSRAAKSHADFDAVYRREDVAETLRVHFKRDLPADFLSRFTDIHQEASLSRARRPAQGVFRLPVEDFGFLCRELDVIGHPTVVVLSESGEVVAIREGILTAEGFFELMKEAGIGAFRHADFPASPAVGDGGVDSLAVRARHGESRALEAVFSGEVLEPRRFDRPTLWSIILDGMGSEEDIDLAVRSADGRLFALSESNESSEALELAVEPGRDYFLRIYSLHARVDSFPYRLLEVFEPVPASRSVPPNLALAAAPGIPAELSNGPGGPTAFRFLPERPGIYDFELSAKGRPEEFRLLDEAGALIASSTSGKASLDVVEPVTITVMPVGAPSSLRLVLNERNSRAFAPSLGLTPGNVIRGRFEGDRVLQEVYRVSSPRPGTWDIVLEGSDEAADIDMELLSVQGELLWRSERPGSRETIRHDIAAGDELFLRVYRYRGRSPVDYVVALMPAAEESEEAYSPEETEVLEAGVARRGEISSNAEVWYRFASPTAGLVSIFVSGEAGAEDLDLAVFDENGERLAVSQSFSTNEAVLVGVDAGATIMIKVFTYGESLGGGFRIWAEPVSHRR